MNAGWLAQLAADHAPPRAGWFPPAIGWWVAAACALLSAALVVWIVRWWREPRRLLKRAALRELRLIRSSPLQGPEAARAIESLLRRHAVALHGSGRVARLTGEKWLAFASASGAEALAGATGRSLLAAAFGAGRREPAREPGLDRERWLAAAAELIRRSGRMERA
ncbi:MAG TPA: DUF4381 domain-containing protein [Steroidobacteraceae bacterium]|nr:DUF4381 domain-containing protein [Steroidobacteraceae bacterium]